jgi:hypothetical protein
MMERCKTLVDAINARHSRTTDLQADAWTDSLRGVHFYDSIVFLEKGQTEPIRDEKRGDYWIPYSHF